MGLAQQHFAGPLAVRVAVGVAVVDHAGRADHPDVGVLGERRRFELVAHADGRHVGEGLELRGERDADQLGGAQRVGPEQLAVGQDVVDQRGGVDDQIDGVGQPLPCLLVEAEVRLALVAGDDLQMLGGQFPVVLQQLRIAAVEGLVQTLTSRRVVLGPHQADQLAVDEVPSVRAIPGPGNGRGIRSRRSTGRCAPQRSGAAASARPPVSVRR